VRRPQIKTEKRRRMRAEGRRSIGARILLAFLLVSISGLLMIAIVSELTLYNIRELNGASNQEIGTIATTGSEQALTEQALGDFEVLAQAKAKTIDETLIRLSGGLRTLALFTETLYAVPDDYPSVRFAHIKDVSPDTLALRWVLSPDMVTDPQFDAIDLLVADVWDETWLLGNIEPIASAVMADEPNISSIYITTASGINVGFGDNAVLTADLDEIELREHPWYIGAQQADGLYISETFRDSFERGLNVTMSLPLHDADGTFKGVIGCDINISDLETVVQETRVSEQSYALLLLQEESSFRIVTAPDINETNEDSLETYLGAQAESLCATMLTEPFGTEEIVTGEQGQTFAAIWAPVEMTSWRLVLAVPLSDIIAPSELLGGDILQRAQRAADDAARYLFIANILIVALALALVGVVVLTARYIARRITRPLVRLSADVERIEGNQLEYHSNINTGDEIEDLSHSFEFMTTQLRQYIEELGEATPEKERVGTELGLELADLDLKLADLDALEAERLKAADDVLEAAELGAASPVVAELELEARALELEMAFGTLEFELLGAMDNASVLTDDAPEATELEAGSSEAEALESEPLVVAELEREPSETTDDAPEAEPPELEPPDATDDVLEVAEPPEAEALESDMSEATDDAPEVTELEAEPPEADAPEAEPPEAEPPETEPSELEPPEATDDAPEVAELATEPPEAEPPEAEPSELEPPEATDDVPEVTELESEPPEADVSEAEPPEAEPPEAEPPEAEPPVAAKSAPVSEVEPPKAADDALALKAESTEQESSVIVDYVLELEAQIAELPRVLSFIEHALEEYTFRAKQISQMTIAAEEIFVNIAHYAYQDTSEQEGGFVRIEIAFDAMTRTALVSLIDKGQPFNPLKRSTPSTEVSIKERPIGGLGIHMARQLVDGIDYRFENGANVLTLHLIRRSH
jgi:anti-sigma regulatory factor (Ser/Thr protein kinase)/HAMP domain-containing protein